ncbi:MAG: hypothetical protein ACREL1_03555 [bacterium]
MKLFRVSFFPVFLCVLLSAAPVILVAFLSQNTWTLEIPKFLMAFGIVGIPISLITAWVFYQYYPAGVSAKGVQGSSFWGFQRIARWDNMKTIKTFRILNLRWACVQSKDKSGVTWIPLFLKKPTAFRSELKSVMPTDNFLLYYLEKKVR